MASASPSRAFRISSFFSSMKVRGTPLWVSWASSKSVQSDSINAGVDLVRNPVRLICIFLGSGTYHNGKVSVGNIVEPTYRMCRVLEQTHGVFNDHFVIKTKKIDNLFHDPRFDDR